MRWFRSSWIGASANTGPEADAKGLYTNEGFVVLKGSTGRLEAVPSFQPTSYFRLREQLVQQGALVADGPRLRFQRDVLFQSPSAAAACVLGRTANGTVEWVDAEGRTLWSLEMRSEPDPGYAPA